MMMPSFIWLWVVESDLVPLSAHYWPGNCLSLGRESTCMEHSCRNGSDGHEAFQAETKALTHKTEASASWSEVKPWHPWHEARPRRGDGMLRGKDEHHAKCRISAYVQIGYRTKLQSLLNNKSHGASRHSGLILMHCFPRLPYSAITAPFQSPFVATIPPYFILGSLHFLSSPPHLPFPSLPVPPEYAYNMPILLHCIQQYRLCYSWRRLWRNVRPTSKSRAVVLQLFSADDDDFLDFSHPITGRRNSNTTRWQHAFSDIDTLFHMLCWMLLRDV